MMLGFILLVEMEGACRAAAGNKRLSEVATAEQKQARESGRMAIEAENDRESGEAGIGLEAVGRRCGSGSDPREVGGL